MKPDMSSKFYTKANNIRTKLLLFIDKEIQSIKKRNPENTKIIKKEKLYEQFLIVIEVTITNKDKSSKEEGWIQYSVRRNKKEQTIKSSKINNKQKINNNQTPIKQSIYTESTCAETPINTPNKKRNDRFSQRTSFHHRTVEPTMKPEEPMLKISDKKRKTFHKKVVSFQNTMLSFKRKTKKSKTVKMRRKPVNGRRFLKELCYTLKKPEAGDRINSCKTFFKKIKKLNAKGGKYKKYEHCETIEEKKDETNIFLDDIDDSKKRLKFSFRTTQKKKDFNFVEFMNKRKNREDNKIIRDSKKKLTVK